MPRRLRLLALLAAAGALAAPAAASAASSPQVRVGVTLERPHPGAEQALFERLYDPASPDFHHFLSTRRFAKRFGVPKATERRTLAWLHKAGLKVLYRDPTGDYILAGGTQAQVNAFESGSAPARLPVATVLTSQGPDRHRTAGLQLSLGLPNIGAQTPQDLWSVYEQPPDVTGKGVSVAILGNGATEQVIEDLHKFDDENHFDRLPVKVVHTPAKGDFSDNSGNGEWDIDMQAIQGMAPGISNEVLYFSPTLADTDLLASEARWVNDPEGPPIMNASLGECEVTPLNDLLNNPALDPINGNENPNALPVSQGLSNSSEPASRQLLRQAVIEGRTLFAASGDTGSSCSILYPGTNLNGVANYVVPLTSDPANDPYAVGVGGTVLYSDGGSPARRVLEYAWTHSGGNPSPFIAAPAYQHGVAGLMHRCILTPDGRPADTGELCRGVPDVAALSGDVISNGYTIVSDGQDSIGGGTSLSSPLWAGMWARVLSTAPPGRRYGFANEAIYAIGKQPQRYAQSFHDITLGGNGLRLAHSGYDYVTGFGTPRLAGLIQNVRAVAGGR